MLSAFATPYLLVIQAQSQRRIVDQAHILFILVIGGEGVQVGRGRASAVIPLNVERSRRVRLCVTTEGSDARLWIRNCRLIG